MFHNSLQISLLQTRSVAASRYRIRWRTKIWWRKADVAEKHREKPCGGRTPAEVEPLEAWSPMTLWMGVRRQPDGMSEANLQRFHLRRGVWKLTGVVVHKSLLHNELAVFRVGKTATLKIVNPLCVRDLRTIQNVSSCPEINHRRNHFLRWVPDVQYHSRRNHISHRRRLHGRHREKVKKV